jgi:magnesium chelatase subunit I
VVPRVSDVYATLPAITGKIELEYEGELKGAETVARDLVRAAVATVFDGRTTGVNTKPVIAWFENGGTIDLSDTTSAAELLAAIHDVDRMEAVLLALGGAIGQPAPERAAVADFILEGLSALKRISRSEQGHTSRRRRRRRGHATVRPRLVRSRPCSKRTRTPSPAAASARSTTTELA